jgi:hypothetical protein
LLENEVVVVLRIDGRNSRFGTVFVCGSLRKVRPSPPASKFTEEGHDSNEVEVQKDHLMTMYHKPDLYYNNNSTNETNICRSEPTNIPHSTRLPHD